MRKPKRTAISERRRPLTNASPRALILFSLPFILVGAGVLIWLAILPLFDVMSAKNWVAVPAHIELAEVITHPGDDDSGESYSLRVSYTYSYNENYYRSTRYGFYDAGSDGARGEKIRQVQALNADAPQTAYVNPDNPFEAVLNRGISWFRTLVVGLGFGGLFLVAGLFIIWTGFAREKSSHQPLESAPLSATPNALPNTLSHSAKTANQRQQRDNVRRTAPTHSIGTPLTPEFGEFRNRLLAIVIFAVIWNAITWMFAGPIIGELENLWSFSGIFMNLFVLVGFALIGGVGYTALAMTNPRISLTLASPSVLVGDTLSVYWQADGRLERLDNLRISLIGEEQASYTRGTDTLTDKAVFYAQPIMINPTDISIGKGSATFNIPDDTMPSWESDNNAIAWRLHVSSDIRRFPNIDESYPIVVVAEK